MTVLTSLGNLFQKVKWYLPWQLRIQCRNQWHPSLLNQAPDKVYPKSWDLLFTGSLIIKSWWEKLQVILPLECKEPMLLRSQEASILVSIQENQNKTSLSKGYHSHQLASKLDYWVMHTAAALLPPLAVRRLSIVTKVMFLPFEILLRTKITYTRYPRITTDTRSNGNLPLPPLTSITQWCRRKVSS